VHEWGEEDARAAVCLHGIAAHGRRFRRLAEETLLPAGFRVLAPDLRGHGHSSWDPPWNLDRHLADVGDTVAARDLGQRTVWIGHSFGGRLIWEQACRGPTPVAERLVLLDPALWLEPAEAREAAEGEREEQSYADRDEAVRSIQESTPRASLETIEEEVRDHFVEGEDGRLRRRFVASAPVTMFGELASRASDPPRAVPTLLVAGEDSGFVQEEHVSFLRDGLGDALQVVTVPGGHRVLWEAFDETAAAIAAFVQ
jgi:lipase